MGTNDMSREPMLEMFLFETNQLIEQLEGIIIECEKNQQLGPEAINEIFRIMHTTKGSAAMMLFNNISEVAHSLEDLFFFVRENKNTKVEFEGLTDLVLAGIDFIKIEIDKIENFNNADGVPDGLVQRSKTYLNSMKSAYEGGSVVTPSETKKEKPMYYISQFKSNEECVAQKYKAHILFEDDCQMENVRAYMVVHNIKDIATELYFIPEDIIENNECCEFIKEEGFLICFETTLGYAKVNELINATSYLKKVELQQISVYPDEIKTLFTKPEISLEDNLDGEVSGVVEKTYNPEAIGKDADNENTAKTNKTQSILSVNISKLDMLMDLVGEIVITEAMVTKNPDLEGLEMDNFNKAARQLRKLTNELQDIVMSIRMVPISMTFHKMNRIVRDMSKKLNKEVVLEIIGEETEVDKNIIDHLSDPLMHLIRNSIDHGLEDSEDRIRLGKSEQGTITLEAKNAGGDVWIIVRDDGKGLSRDKILEKARSQGLVTKPENELSDKEIYSFILLPGFSTKDKVTEFSGRGVGMDVVKKNIDSIGGNISIESIQGLGTTILIKIPLTLAIIDGMEVGVGKAKYTIPITSIRECFKVEQRNVICDSDDNEMIMIRGQAYPVIRIHRIFKKQTEVTAIKDGIMIMVEGDSRAACLFADELLGEQQVVVKALPKYLKKVEGVAGCTILGDGSISLILDINNIIEK